jgi:catechol 2,3-dioxygenase-like lactoylglutathione lyase family enzyme
MSRVQLALNVTDLEAAIGFYTAMLGTGPAKVRDGYANFAVAEPPLKLVLIAGGDAAGGTLNHLGIEVDGTGEVVAASDRFRAAGLPIDERAAETCCYATQDKVWVHDPDGAPWEVYTVLADADRMHPDAEPAVAAPAGTASVACC